MTAANASVKEWLGTREACALLGVSPATLRRWSDVHDLVAFTTPGGHRRFARSTLLSTLPPSPRERPTLRRLDETGEHMALICRRSLPEACEGMAWTEGLSASERDLLRRRGRAIATSLVAGLGAGNARRRGTAVAEAAVAAAECGRIAAAHEIGVRAGVEMFLRFRRVFLAELVDLVRRRRMGTTEVTELVVAATEAFDELLLAMLSGYAGHSGVGEAS